MHYLCARCHMEFTAEAGASESGDSTLACPRCHAEAGLEPEHGIPVAMKLFGMVLATVIVFALGGGVLTRLVG